jgi:exopolyphosphatase/guanosine-5'-triphosphate,3'-diphosphate pyrophosphatase
MHLKFAAIDVGSNGVRLLLARVIENHQPYTKKDTLVRMPIRLGADVFSGRAIAPNTIGELTKTMNGFRQLIDAYGALAYEACATAAMREATNGETVVQAVREETDIDLQIIDGAREAEIIALNEQNPFDLTKRPHLFVDIGGGSTELTLFEDGRSTERRSFPIGTVRILLEAVPLEAWDTMKSWLKEIKAQQDNLVAVGSGGNINKLFRMSRVSPRKPLRYAQIKSLYRQIGSYSLAERVRVLNMRPDRADVIVPATKIVLSIMKWAKITKMFVPEVGLADGLIHMLYKQYRKEHPVRA